MRHIINIKTGETTVEPDAPVIPQSPEQAAAIARSSATTRIAKIRAEMADHLADLAIGNPSEQGTARAALGLLRAELAVEKAAARDAQTVEAVNNVAW